MRNAAAFLLLGALATLDVAGATAPAATLEKVLAEGTFAYASPDKVRWDYVAPTPVVMLIAEGRLTTWYPEVTKAETLEVTRFQDRIFKYMGAGSALDELSSFFNFRFTEKKQSDSYRLDLSPKTRQIAKRVKSISITIDRETYLTNRIEYVEGDGDTTIYEFSNIRVNEPIDASRFELDLPPETRIEKIRLD